MEVAKSQYVTLGKKSSHSIQQHLTEKIITGKRESLPLHSTGHWWQILEDLKNICGGYVHMMGDWFHIHIFLFGDLQLNTVIMDLSLLSRQLAWRANTENFLGASASHFWSFPLKE